MAYYYAMSYVIREVILKIGDTSATREELNCLSPGQTIDDKVRIDSSIDINFWFHKYRNGLPILISATMCCPQIFKLMALKCTSNQRKITLKTTWCLPPSFVVCIIDHNCSSWMLAASYFANWLLNCCRMMCAKANHLRIYLTITSSSIWFQHRSLITSASHAIHTIFFLFLFFFLSPAYCFS